MANIALSWVKSPDINKSKLFSLANLMYSGFFKPNPDMMPTFFIN